MDVDTYAHPPQALQALHDYAPKMLEVLETINLDADDITIQLNVTRRMLKGCSRHRHGAMNMALRLAREGDGVDIQHVLFGKHAAATLRARACRLQRHGDGDVARASPAPHQSPLLHPCVHRPRTQPRSSRG